MKYEGALKLPCFWCKISCDQEAQSWHWDWMSPAEPLESVLQPVAQETHSVKRECQHNLYACMTLRIPGSSRKKTPRVRYIIWEQCHCLSHCKQKQFNRTRSPRLSDRMLVHIIKTQAHKLCCNHLSERSKKKTNERKDKFFRSSCNCCIWSNTNSEWFPQNSIHQRRLPAQLPYHPGVRMGQKTLRKVIYTIQHPGSEPLGDTQELHRPFFNSWALEKQHLSRLSWNILLPSH